jgi:hypothetical protein
MERSKKALKMMVGFSCPAKKHYRAEGQIDYLR